MAKLNKEEFIASLKEMSVLELNELVKAIEEEFGVTAAAPVAVAAGAAAAVEEGPSEVSVILKSAGASKSVSYTHLFKISSSWKWDCPIHGA